MKNADLLVMGIPRSGSTLMASLLHVPPAQWMIYERRRWVMLEEIEAFKKMKKWGGKQMNVPDVVKFMKLYRPKTLVFMTRNIRDAGMSYATRCEDYYGPLFGEDQVKLNTRKRCQMIMEMANLAVKIKESGGVRVGRGFQPIDLWVRYEDLITKPDRTLEKIRSVTGWKTSGDPKHFFTSFKHMLPRRKEAEKHQGKISTLSLGKYENAETPEEVNNLVDGCRKYTEIFYPEE
jgi:hypothetical protein